MAPMVTSSNFRSVNVSYRSCMEPLQCLIRKKFVHRPCQSKLQLCVAAVNDILFLIENVVFQPVGKTP